MTADDKSRAGEGMAIDWIAGRSEMSDDLALLVSGMEQPLDETARAFLLTVGNAARAAAKRAELAARGAPKPTPTGTPPAPGPIDVDFGLALGARARAEGSVRGAASEKLAKVRGRGRELGAAPRRRVVVSRARDRLGGKLSAGLGR